MIFLDASSGGLLSPPPLAIPEVSACGWGMCDDVCSLRKKARRKEGEERKVEGDRVGSNRFCIFR